MMMRLSMYQQAIVAGIRVFKLLDEQELAPTRMRSPNERSKRGKLNLRMLAFPMMESEM